MKVCFIVTGLSMGGAECQVCNLADSLSTLGHKVLILALNGDIIVRPKSNNIEVVNLNICKTPLGLLKGLFYAKRILNEYRPDVVHSHMIHANIFSRILRLCTSFPKLICTTHSTNDGGIIRLFFYKITNFLSDINTHVSQEGVDIYLNKKAVKINEMICVPNGIDIDKFTFSEVYRKEKRTSLNLGDETLLYLSVGRFTEAKDHPNLLRAFSRSLDFTKKDIRLALIGTGLLENDIKSLAVELGIDDKIFFLGQQSDIEKWLSAADFYVLSSAWEGLPLVVAEAMSSSCYVIATDCGGVKELLDNNGILVPPKKYIELSSAIINSISLDSSLRESDIINARKRIVNHFSLKAVTEKWIDIYRKY